MRGRLAMGNGEDLDVVILRLRQQMRALWRPDDFAPKDAFRSSATATWLLLLFTEAAGVGDAREAGGGWRKYILAAAVGGRGALEEAVARQMVQYRRRRCRLVIPAAGLRIVWPSHAGSRASQACCSHEDGESLCRY